LNALAIEVQQMAPEGIGDELLREWAPWARDDREGERASWSVKPRVDPGYHGDPPNNFFIVDKIVAPHRRDKSSYWKAVSAYYLGERPPWEIASLLGSSWDERRVMYNIIAFAALVEREWRDYNASRRVVIRRARNIYEDTP
jgi:hypothetical protein